MDRSDRADNFAGSGGWELAVGRDQLLLIDRQKWAASWLLRFELDTLLGQINPDALLAVVTLPPLSGKLTPLHPDHFHHQGA